MTAQARTQVPAPAPVGGFTLRFLTGTDPRVPARSAPQASDVDQAKATEPVLRPCRQITKPAIASDISGLFDLRRIIEDGAIRQIVLHASAEELTTLDAFRTPFPGEIRGVMDHSAPFHLTIARLSDNPHLVQETARLLVACEMATAKVRSKVTLATATLAADRAAMIDAVQARDADTATRLAAQYLARLLTLTMPDSKAASPATQD